MSDEHPDPGLAAPSRPRAPLWPVIIGLLLVTGVGLGMVLGLSRSAAVTLLGGSGDEESSLNWAGYVAVHGHFTSVSASWTVPAVRAGSAPRLGGDAREDGAELRFETTVRLNSETDLDYYRNGGILPMVLRQLMTRDTAAR